MRRSSVEECEFYRMVHKHDVGSIRFNCITCLHQIITTDLLAVSAQCSHAYSHFNYILQPKFRMMIFRYSKFAFIELLLHSATNNLLRSLVRSLVVGPILHCMFAHFHWKKGGLVAMINTILPNCSLGRATQTKNANMRNITK